MLRFKEQGWYTVSFVCMMFAALFATTIHTASAKEEQEKQCSVTLCTAIPLFIGAEGSVLPSQINGAQATIDLYSPCLCDGTTAQSSAWAMMEVYDSDPERIAQVGWIHGKANGGNVWTFYEFSTASGYDPGPHMVTAVWNGNCPVSFSSSYRHKYTVYTDGNNVTQFVIDGAGVAHTTLGWVGSEATWYEETYNQEDHLGGGYFPVNFIGMQQLSHGTWQNINALYQKDYPDPSVSNGIWNPNNSMEVWDTRSGS